MMTPRNQFRPKRNSQKPNSRYAKSGAAFASDGEGGPLLTPAEAEAEVLRNVPPHSVESEQAVLGGVLIRSDSLLNILDIVKEEDFYLPAHRVIFAAMAEMSAKGMVVDLTTVNAFLQDHDSLEAAGGTVYLAELAGGVVSAANAEYHAGRVRDKAQLRLLIGTSSDIIGKCFEPGADTQEILDDSERAILSVSERHSARTYASASDLVNTTFTKLEDRAKLRETVTGVNTGFTRLNELTAGFQPSDLIIIAARPSMGKTAFVLNIAMRAAVTHGVPVGIFSLEMSMEQLMLRMLCAWGQVDLSRMLRPHTLRDEDWMRLRDAASVLSGAPLFIDDTPALSILDLRTRCRKLKREKQLGMVVIDYLQLMRASRRVDSRELEISEISRGLKALAKELDIPVVALAQLNRKVEERADKRPMLSDLRESGAIEQDADVIMFIYRDAVYKNKVGERPKEDPAEIIIGKQRNGPVDSLHLLYRSSYTRFEDMVFSPDAPFGV